MKKRITKQIYLFLYISFKQTINIFMNLREKVNALFAKHNVSLSAEEVVEVKQMVEAILEDGTSIYSDSDVWAAGVRVFGKDAEGNEVVLADGEYKTAESIIVVVADGVVTELKPMEEEKEPEVEVVIEEEQTSEVVAEESLSAEVEGLLSLVGLVLQEGEVRRRRSCCSVCSCCWYVHTATTTATTVELCRCYLSYLRCSCD